MGSTNISEDAILNADQRAGGAPKFLRSPVSAREFRGLRGYGRKRVKV